MADESNMFVINKAEEVDYSKLEEYNKNAKIVEGDSRETKEETLVYDRLNSEASEDSGMAGVVDKISEAVIKNYI